MYQIWWQSDTNCDHQCLHKIGLAGYDILFVYLVVEAKSKNIRILIYTINLQYECCGAEGPHDWASSVYNKEKRKSDQSVLGMYVFVYVLFYCCKCSILENTPR